MMLIQLDILKEKDWDDVAMKIKERGLRVKGEKRQRQMTGEIEIWLFSTFSLTNFTTELKTQ